jgi:hypothetical protein
MVSPFTHMPLIVKDIAPLSPPPHAVVYHVLLPSVNLQTRVIFKDLAMFPANI